MIKVLLKNSKQITFELGDEKREMDLVTRFHNGLDGNTMLKLKANNKGLYSRIRVSDIQNMQYLKDAGKKSAATGMNDACTSPHDSRFKTREEYERWKEEKIKENKLKSEKREIEKTIPAKK